MVGQPKIMRADELLRKGTEEGSNRLLVPFGGLGSRRQDREEISFIESERTIR